MVKGAKEVILFDPRNNHQLYETNLQRAQFEVTKNHDSYELVRRGLLERNCFKILKLFDSIDENLDSSVQDDTFFCNFYELNFTTSRPKAEIHRGHLIL